MKAIGQEIQHIMIEYREQFGNEDDNYIYVYYDFGELIMPDKMIQIKSFLKA